MRALHVIEKLLNVVSE